ncbi:MAG: rhodanese-like domain-containing protein [Cyclobacteriaceae bacterium]|jgi:rhodanese-related sulfurtransferase|nr:rhodanese-like domain-containing protein [Cyclobacteriaceae bacterium]
MAFKKAIGLGIWFVSNMVLAQPAYDQKLKSLYRHTVKTLTPAQLAERQANDPSLIVLDTRSRAEYRVSHLPGARFLDYDHYQPAELEALPRQATIVVYCSVGYRSERIGERLQKKGYKNVFNLYGGIFQWKNEGREVVNASNHPTDSVHTYNQNWGRWLTRGIRVYK